MSLIEIIILFPLVGLGAGFIAGIFGLGGGAVLVPVFLFLFPRLGAMPAVLTHQAIGTSLAIIVPSALAASFKQYRMGNLDFSLLIRWVPFVIVGAIGAALIFPYVPAMVLRIVFIVYLFFCAVYMYFKKTAQIQSDDSVKLIPWWSRLLGGVFVGAISTFLGIGGGTFTVPYYITYHYPMKKAVATSSATGVFIGLVAALFAIGVGFGRPGLAEYSFGFVNWMAVLIIAPFSMLTASLGAKVSNILADSVLKTLYIIFLFIIIGFVVYATWF